MPEPIDPKIVASLLDRLRRANPDAEDQRRDAQAKALTDDDCVGPPTQFTPEEEAEDDEDEARKFPPPKKKGSP